MDVWITMRERRPVTPSGVFLLRQSVLAQPQEGLQIGSRCRVRLIGGIQMAAI